MIDCMDSSGGVVFFLNDSVDYDCIGDSVESDCKQNFYVNVFNDK